MGSLIELENCANYLNVNVNSVSANTLTGITSLNAPTVNTTNINCSNVVSSGSITATNINCSNVVSSGSISATKYSIVTLSGGNTAGNASVGTISNTNVTADSIIICSYCDGLTHVLPLNVTSQTAGVSFTVVGDAGASFNYFIIN